MKVLVIGASGVIGSAASSFFKERGDTVIDWDIEISPSHDLRVQGALDATLKDEAPDVALFLAFDVGGSKYPIESAEYVSNNMRIIQNTLGVLGKYKVPFIHTTSQMSNMDHNPYGPLKRIAEFHTKYLGGVNVKVWNVYGPENVGPKSHAIADFIEQAKTLKRIQMLSDGQEVRQFLHARDFARALSIIVDRYTEFSGKTVDISSFKWTSIHEVANVVAAVCGPGVDVVPGHVVSGFQTKVNTPGEDFLNTGWTPCISLEDGIKSCLKY